MASPFISFLTDFGTDSAPAVCRGVMWSVSPEARILDLGHVIRKFAVHDGAFRLSCAVGYLPVGVHVAVVDPGVGTARRGLAIRVGRGDVLVGPDNGLLMPAARVLGGVSEARALTNAELFLPTVAPTFHGRDVFAPVAAHLANGIAFEQVGPTIDEGDLVDLRLPEASARDGGLDSAVLYIDTFGNVRVAGQPNDLEAAAGPLTPGRRFRALAVGTAHELPWVATFGDVRPGELLLYDDADYAGLAFAVNQGSAADRLGLLPDDPVRIEPA